MLFADVMFSTEAIAIIVPLVLALAGTISYLFKMLMDSKNEQIKLAALVSERDSYKEIAIEATNNLEVVANEKQVRLGRPKVKPIVPVIAEHSSPPTVEQLATAALQTVRARLVAYTLALDLPARGQGG